MDHVELPPDFTVWVHQCRKCKYLSFQKWNVAKHIATVSACANSEMASERFYASRAVVAAPAPAPTTTRPALTSIVGNNNVVINNIFVLNDEDITETMDQVIEKNSLALETLVQDAIEDMPATVFRFTRGRDSEDPRLTNVWTKKKQVIEMLQNGITTMGPRAFAAKELPRLLRVIANMLNGPGTRENPSVYKDIAWRLHSVPFGKRKGKKNTSHTLQQAAELYHSCNTAFTQTVSDVHKTTLFPICPLPCSNERCSWSSTEGRCAQGKYSMEDSSTASEAF